jgi:3-hydroxy-9,10-secoandrosta-1,3,5(10)-triene-9,17-dione monooxygenase reductase component
VRIFATSLHAHPRLRAKKFRHPSNDKMRGASMQSCSNHDIEEFRKVLGVFTTGVTIVTARGFHGEPVGITANSFNSVSLRPPMVLWSLAAASRSRPAFDATSLWAVHILSADQDMLSNRFAQSGADKFDGIELATGVGNLPLLTGCAARLQCRTSFKREAGDHIIFVGDVLDFDRCDLPPLVFQSGSYALATRKNGHANECRRRNR